MIAVSDWEASNPFYRDVLGAEVVTRGAGFAYRFGTEQLNVHGPGVDADPVARDPRPPGNSTSASSGTAPIAGAVEHLERHGVAVELGPVERHGARGAGTSVYFRDPDGSLLEFICLLMLTAHAVVCSCTSSGDARATHVRRARLPRRIGPPRATPAAPPATERARSRTSPGPSTGVTTRSSLTAPATSPSR